MRESDLHSDIASSAATSLDPDDLEAEALPISTMVSSPNEKDLEYSTCPFSTLFKSQAQEARINVKTDQPSDTRNVLFPRPTTTKSTPSPPSMPISGIGLTGKQLERVFPFHFAIDANMKIVQCGRKLADYLFPGHHQDSDRTQEQDKEQAILTKQGDLQAKAAVANRKQMKTSQCLLGRHVGEIFHMARPQGVSWDWSALSACKERAAVDVEAMDTQNDEDKDCGSEMELEVELIFVKDPNKPKPCSEMLLTSEIIFLGNMVFSATTTTTTTTTTSCHQEVNQDFILFLLHPDLHNLNELQERSLSLSDLPRHSAQCDVILMGEQLKQETCYGLSLDAAYKSAEREKKKVISALNTKRVFVRYVSHEIRTPLNITLLGLQHLESLMNPIIEQCRHQVQSHSQSQSQSQGHCNASSSMRENEEPQPIENEALTLICKAKEMAMNLIQQESFTTPSNPIASHSQDVKHMDSTSETVDEVIEEVLDTVEDVKASCRVAVDIVNDLLLFERLDNGIFYIAKSIVSLPEVLRRVVSLFTVQARSLEIDLKFVEPVKSQQGQAEEEGEEEEEMDRIKVDISKFDQVLRNLVSNALKFTPSPCECSSTIDQTKKNDRNKKPSVIVSYEIVYRHKTEQQVYPDHNDHNDHNDDDDEEEEDNDSKTVLLNEEVDPCDESSTSQGKCSYRMTCCLFYFTIFAEF
jgi:signal transduction histidine kinase